MIYNTTDIVEANDLKLKVKEYISKGYTVELKQKSNKRNSQQNRGLHKFFVIISDTLNELGQEFHYTGLKGLELSTRYTPEIVKNFFWRPIQIAMFNIESTTELDTKMINEVAEVIIKFFAEKGVHITFPSRN